LDFFSEVVDGGAYIIGGFKGNMKVNLGVQQDLELVPVFLVPESEWEV
jgi:hypothetical protein